METAVERAEAEWGEPITTVDQGVSVVVVVAEAPEGGRMTSDVSEAVATDRSGGSLGGRTRAGVVLPGVGAPTEERTPGGVGRAEAEGSPRRMWARALARRSRAEVIREECAASGVDRGG